MDELESWAARVVTAVRTGAYEELIRGLAGLAPGPEVTALLSVVAAGQRSTGPVNEPEPDLVLAPDSPAARLLRAIGAFPGRPASELRGLTLLDEPDFAVTARILIDTGLVTSTRFEKPDCWTRTTRGAQAARLLG